MTSLTSIGGCDIARSRYPGLRTEEASGTRVLLTGEEKLGAGATELLWLLPELGDPGAEVAIAYRIKERLRDFYRVGDPDGPSSCSRS
jgi:hypothetical protein